MTLNLFAMVPPLRCVARVNVERAITQLSCRTFASSESTKPKANSEPGALEDTHLQTRSESTLKKLKNAEITINEPNYLGTVSGVPEEHLFNRRARIYKQAKNAMQSGTYNTHKWTLDYENRERWENPLMGWTSTGDPLSNMNLWFRTKDEAIEYCQRQGIYYEVDEPQERRNLKKTYAENFSWSKRTRVGSK